MLYVVYVHLCSSYLCVNHTRTTRNVDLNKNAGCKRILVCPPIFLYIPLTRNLLHISNNLLSFWGTYFVPKTPSFIIWPQYSEGSTPIMLIQVRSLCKLLKLATSHLFEWPHAALLCQSADQPRVSIVGTRDWSFFFSLFLSKSSKLICPIITTVTVHHSYSFPLETQNVAYLFQKAFPPSGHRRPHPFHRTAFTDSGLLNGFLFSFSINLLFSSFRPVD